MSGLLSRICASILSSSSARSRMSSAWAVSLACSWAWALSSSPSNIIRYCITGAASEGADSARWRAVSMRPCHPQTGASAGRSAGRGAASGGRRIPSAGAYHRPPAPQHPPPAATLQLTWNLLPDRISP